METPQNQKHLIKKIIYSLYQFFTIIKAANYRYLEFVSSFNDHSGGQKKLSEVTKPGIEKERSYRGLNFFDTRNLEVLAAISRGKYMTFGMRGERHPAASF